MAEAERKCPNCGGILEKGRFGLICKNCNKEFYYEEKASDLMEGRQGPPCPVCSWKLIRSPDNPRLYACSNGNCPTRSLEGDIPYTLDEFKNAALTLKRIDGAVENAIQTHVNMGGRSPRTWEEAREIVISRYPELIPLLTPPKTKKVDKNKDMLLTLFIDELLKKGWSEEEIVSYLIYTKLQKIRKKSKGE